MGILQEFCDALYEETKTYEAKKTAKKKKLHPIRQQDVIQLTQLLEKAKEEKSTNIPVLYQQISNFLEGIKTVRLMGFIILSSDLRIHLLQVLAKPQFSLTQMMLMELQEKQTNQCDINIKLSTQLIKHEQEIALLNTHLEERDELCEVLKTRCATLEVENAQLKESLKACADENTTERFNQLHSQVAEQQTTIKQLRRENENEKNKTQTIKSRKHTVKRRKPSINRGTQKSRAIIFSSIHSEKCINNVGSLPWVTIKKYIATFKPYGNACIAYFGKYRGIKKV